MIKFFLLFLFFSVSLSAQDYIRGLSRVNMDSWSQHLSNANTRLPTYSSGESQLNEQLIKRVVLEPSRILRFEIIKRMLNRHSYSKAEDYLKVAEDIVQFRDRIRKAPDRNLDIKRDTLYMLQLMAEEALYIGSSKNSNFPKVLTITGDAVTSSNRAYSVDGLNIQTADVVLSKSAGSGSSSLISYAGKNPHIVSHSSPAYVSADGNELLSPEAFIEDGVLLRDLRQSFSADSRVRTLIYRINPEIGTLKLDRLALATDTFVKGMSNVSANPRTKAAYSYNFKMTIYTKKTQDPSLSLQPKAESFYCSAVSYRIYADAGLTGTLNPYNPQLWSPVVNGVSSLFQTLGITASKIAVPGDLEANPNFDLVAMQIHVNKLLDERIENAILDNFLLRLDARSPLMVTLRERIKDIGDDSLNKEQLEELINTGLIKKDMAHLILANLNKIPDNISIKQLIFFYILNEVVTPKLREEIKREVMQREDSLKVTGPQMLRQLSKKKVRLASITYTRTILAGLDKIMPRSASQISSSKTCQSLF